MPTSNKTNVDVLKILDRYLDSDKAIEMFDKLSKVEGNSSFKKSIESISKLLKNRGL